MVRVRVRVMIRVRVRVRALPVAGRGAFSRGERGGVLPCAQELGHAAVATRVEERACLGFRGRGRI